MLFIRTILVLSLFLVVLALPTSTHLEHGGEVTIAEHGRMRESRKRESRTRWLALKMNKQKCIWLWFRPHRKVPFIDAIRYSWAFPRFVSSPRFASSMFESKSPLSVTELYILVMHESARYALSSAFKNGRRYNKELHEFHPDVIRLFGV
ncbi:hypothetical protein BC826DRAFT_1178446 [Russula brevipes]|nr:hypothetical protein BC826DRAFT_1178446 [Russula brevipes]